MILRRILLAWLVANFLIIGAVSWLSGGWYLGWPTSPAIVMLAEVGLIMLPNLLLPVLTLRYWWPVQIDDVKSALGWKWNGWRLVIIGIAAFLMAYILTFIVNRLVGESIPYNQPGVDGGIQVQNLTGVIGLLLGLLAFTLMTVLAEETMFRGWIQTQVGKRYGVWAGLVLAALLFGLRHLPADVYYAHLWHATNRMWLSRQLQLYIGAGFLGLARHYGQSTFASAIMHFLLLILALFGA
jgi:membrane protease YdiL (CAAX protease family)